MPGRIRTLKPELLEDEKTASLSDTAFRLFVSIILLADDHGNLRASPKWLEGQVWWCSTDSRDIIETLGELGDLIAIYSCHGQTYIHLAGWFKHQKIDHPSKPRVPVPDDDANILSIQEFRHMSRENLARTSRDTTETLAPDLRSPISDPIPTTDHHTGQNHDPKQTACAAPAAARVRKPVGETSPDFDAFWTAYPKRKAKRDAMKAWTQTKDARPSIEAIVQAIKAQALTDEWRKEQGQYIPLPASWLRAGRWDDDVSTVTVVERRENFNPYTEEHSQEWYIAEGKRLTS